MKKKKYKIQLSENETQSDFMSEKSNFQASFYTTEPKNFRTHSAEVVERLQHSPVDFKKQTARPEFLTHAQPVHENRFLPFNDNPRMSSRHKAINCLKFDQYMPRKFEEVGISLREKDLNFGAVDKNTRKGLAFDKRSGRRYKSSERYYEDKALDVGYSALDRNIGGFDIGKSSSRKAETDLPLFMVNFVNRGKNVSFKTLKMNGYMTCDFMPLGSSFGMGKIERTGFPIAVKGRCPQIVRVLREKLKMA